MHNLSARLQGYDKGQLYEYKLWVPRGINAGGCGIHMFCTLRVISHATLEVPSIFQWLRLRTAWLGSVTTGLQNTTAGASYFPLFFFFHHLTCHQH